MSEKDFSTNTVTQALITFFITVFIGGYFSKWLELRNVKKIELYKIRTALSLTLIDLTSAFYYKPENQELRRGLARESSKVKLYFPDEVLKRLNVFIESEDKAESYNMLIDCLRKNVG